MPTPDSKHLDEQSKGLVRAAALIALVFFVGVVGYMGLGGPEYGLGDAIYMTMITLTTVGYGEVIDLSHNPEGRVFTSALLVFGVGSFVYFFSNLTAFMVEGSLDRILWRRRMRRSINALDKHFIICGGGLTGRCMVRELLETERAFVLVDIDEESARALIEEMGSPFATVIGDATDDEVLRQAGIERASGLCAAITHDKDNLLVVMSARMLRPDLRIVAGCSDEKIHAKLARAGADAIVMPNEIGGMRMVSELIRPDAVTFLDTMLRDKQKRVRIEELALAKQAQAVGRTIGALRADAVEDLLIIALREQGSERWVFNPNDQIELAAGHSIVLMTSPEGRRSAEERWG